MLGANDWKEKSSSLSDHLISFEKICANTKKNKKNNRTALKFKALGCPFSIHTIGFCVPFWKHHEITDYNKKNEENRDNDHQLSECERLDVVKRGEGGMEMFRSVLKLEKKRNPPSVQAIKQVSFRRDSWQIRAIYMKDQKKRHPPQDGLVGRTKL